MLPKIGQMKESFGLCLDERVVSTGYNVEGQCDTHSWTDIVSIDTGKHSSVGLRADGTVVATGGKNEKR